jgi:CHAT domain-containing protein/tetratricopeptide (TPR) repeat protein
MKRRRYGTLNLFFLPAAAFFVVVAIFSTFGTVHAQILDSVARSFESQVWQLQREGRYADAVAVAEDLLAARENVLRKTDPDLVRSQWILGVSYREAGRYPEAERMLKRTVDSRERRYGKRHWLLAASLNSLAMVYQFMARYEEAAILYKRILEIREKKLGKNHPDVAVSLSNLGMLCRTMGDYGKAETLFKESLRIREGRFGKNHPDTAWSLGDIGDMWRIMGHYGKAEPLLFRSLKIREDSLGWNNPSVASSLDLLGLLYVATGKYAEAKSLFTRSLDIKEQSVGKGHPNVASTLNHLGVSYQTTGQYGEAEEVLKRSLEIRKKTFGEHHPSVATSLGSLGILCQITGRYGEAEELFKRSLRIRETALGLEHPDVGTSLGELGILYRITGRYGDAESLLKRCIEIREMKLGKDHPSLAASLKELALFFQAMGRYGEAEPLFRACLEIREKKLGKDHPSAKSNRNDLALLLLDSGKLDEAYDIFSQLNSMSGFGRYHLVIKDYPEAVKQFSRGLASVKDKPEPRSIIGFYIGLGLAYEGTEEHSKAAENFRGAIEVIEAEWKTLRPEDKSNFLNAKVWVGFTRLEAYEGLARVLLKSTDRESVGKALQVSERVKSRVFLEMLATREVWGKSAEDEAVLRQDREHQQGLMAVRRQIDVLTWSGPTTPSEEVGRLQFALKEKEKDYGKFIEEVKLKNLELSSLISVDPPSHSAIQALLDPDVELLEYYTTRDKTYAWLVSRENIRVYEIGVTDKELREKVDRLLLPNISNRPRKAEPMIVYVDKDEKETGEAEREENRKRFQTVLKELYEAIVAPAEKDIHAKNLIVVPHGVLHKVPFGALTDGTRYFAEKHTISMLPSAGVLEHVVKKRKEAKGRALVLANPKTDHIPLGYAEAEGKMLETLFPDREAYYRESATETKAKLRSSDFNVIHFATHGEFNERQPMQSGLLLTRDDENDGYLQVHEVFAMDLKNASLVTLSACETALSKVQGGDDLVGLSRGFIYAGTPSILATLWKVDDASTARLMEIFYRNWKSGMSKAEALRRAQEAVRGMKGYEHPFYWAPFIMIGDWK